MPVKAEDLKPEDRKRLGIPAPRRRRLSKDDVRSHAIRALAELAGLTQTERERVLRHAIRVNAV